MDAKAILDNLLETSQRATKSGLNLAEERLGVPESGEQRDAMLSGMGKGALAAGAVALLLGTKGGRNLTGTALKVGGLAAVGGLAYKAYNNWQSQQQAPATVDTGTPIDQLAAPAANQRSESIVRAMISAAKADGHIDANEKQRIESTLKTLQLEQDVTSFLLDEINKPADVQAVAASADTPETAAELYLASAMVVDLNSSAERQYMDALATAMGLAPTLAKDLERQVAI